MYLNRAGLANVERCGRVRGAVDKSRLYPTLGGCGSVRGVLVNGANPLEYAAAPLELDCRLYPFLLWLRATFMPDSFA